MLFLEKIKSLIFLMTFSVKFSAFLYPLQIFDRMLVLAQFQRRSLINVFSIQCKIFQRSIFIPETHCHKRREWIFRGPLFQLLNILQIVSFSRLGIAHIILNPSQRWKSHSSVCVMISVFLLLINFQVIR